MAFNASPEDHLPPLSPQTISSNQWPLSKQQQYYKPFDNLCFAEGNANPDLTALINPFSAITTTVPLVPSRNEPIAELVFNNQTKAAMDEQPARKKACFGFSKQLFGDSWIFQEEDQKSPSTTTLASRPMDPLPPIDTLRVFGKGIKNPIALALITSSQERNTGIQANNLYCRTLEEKKRQEAKAEESAKRQEAATALPWDKDKFNRQNLQAEATKRAKFT
ncbi:hypothetical protein DFH28DRAFT_1148047 [Melampsora americana]|nr:hypothetical protein DFH28DRAFT_1148047 [Melampsora americana]